MGIPNSDTTTPFLCYGEKESTSLWLSLRPLNQKGVAIKMRSQMLLFLIVIVFNALIFLKGDVSFDEKLIFSQIIVIVLSGFIINRLTFLKYKSYAYFYDAKQHRLSPPEQQFKK